MQATTDTHEQRRHAVTNPPRAWSELAPPPVRVCFLIDELAAAGTETQLLALIRHLDPRRVTPYLCLLHGDRPSSRRLEPNDCPVIRLGVQRLARPRTLGAARRFLNFLRREHIDVLQVYFPDSTYFGIPLAWLARVPCRIRTRNNLGHWLNRGHRLAGRLLNGLTTHTIANCNAARTALLRDERPDPQRVFVLENGVDLERFGNVPPLRDKPAGAVKTVAAVANLRAVKGLDLLVEAARRLLAGRPHLRFRVAGEGDQRPALEQLIRQHDLVGKFELPGAIDDIPAFLADADVAVLCSRAEGMPNSVLEYMAAARPIVATNVGAVPDLLVDGVHGLVVPPGNTESLAAAIERLLGTPQLALVMGVAARARVEQCYSRQAMVRRFEDFYVGIAAGRRTGV
jgi:L-malate glycosyltransferase